MEDANVVFDDAATTTKVEIMEDVDCHEFGRLDAKLRVICVLRHVNERKNHARGRTHPRWN